LDALFSITKPALLKPVILEPVILRAKP